jgi:MFS family permease
MGRTEETYFSVNVVFRLLFVVNLLNFVDRGIIPGAANEFDDFIQETLNTNSPDVFLGLLQSAFIIGFLVGSVTFGYLLHTTNRFLLIARGLCIWLLAVGLCAISFYAKSYVLLAFGRMLSGVGEAALQCSVPPWIQDVAPSDSKGTWLSLFLMAIPVGTALGYTYGAFIANSIGWQWAFFIEGLAMFSFVLVMYRIAAADTGDTDLVTYVEERLSRTSVVSIVGPHSKDLKCESIEEKTNATRRNTHHNRGSLKDGALPAYSLWQEIKLILDLPLFCCLNFIYAAQTFTLLGMATFGSQVRSACSL